MVRCVLEWMPVGVFEHGRMCEYAVGVYIGGIEHGKMCWNCDYSLTF